MSARLVTASAVAVVGLTLLAARVFDLSFERAAVLAPVIVVMAGAVAGLAVLFARAGLESLRQIRHRRRVAAIATAAVALIVALTLLGIELPRE